MSSRGVLAGLTGLFAVVGLAGCQSLPSEALKPAVLDNSSAKVSAEIKQIIIDEMGFQEARIADNAFVNKSWIVMVKQAVKTVDNPNIQGRDMQQPVRFQLMKGDTNCYLVRASNSQRWLLTNVSCRYE